jgi:hypothetical protein
MLQTVFVFIDVLPGVVCERCARARFARAYATRSWIILSTIRADVGTVGVQRDGASPRGCRLPSACGAQG